MSLANFYSLEQNQIVIPSLDAMNLEINNIPFNGSGGNSNITNITSSDNSVVITNTGGTINITKAGQNWSYFPGIIEVNLGQNMLSNAGGFNFASFTNSNSLSLYQGYSDCPTGLNGLYICDGIQGAGSGNVGNIYDSKFNPPTLSDCLVTSRSAGGYDITDIGKLSCGTSISIGNLSISNVSGVLNVTNGTSTGEIYDSVINQPPSVSATKKMKYMAIFNNSNENMLTINSTPTLLQSLPLSTFLTGNMASIDFTVFTTQINSNGTTFTGKQLMFYITTATDYVFDSTLGNCCIVTVSSAQTVNQLPVKLFFNITPPIINLYIVCQDISGASPTCAFSNCILSGFIGSEQVSLS